MYIYSPEKEEVDLAKDEYLSGDDLGLIDIKG